MSAATTGEENQSSSSFPWEEKQLFRRISLAEIESVTQNFDEGLVIGRGGFGKVYKGPINNGSGTIAAIKRLDSYSTQGASEFWAEIEMLSKLRHCHLVSLIGYCNDGNEMILVYEYMPRGTLEDHLHKDGTILSWVQRLQICIGAARGLHYLHTGTGTQHGVIHRDVKSSNILVDENWAAKISDFGLSKMGPTNQPSTYVNTIVKGTFGYLDPEYFLTSRLTRKSDVYAFGVVLLEVLCGRRAIDTSLNEEQWGLARWAQECIEEGKLSQIIDSRMRGKISPKCLKEFAHIAIRCVHGRPKLRPTMAEVVVSLELAMTLQERANNPTRPTGLSAFTRKVQRFFFAPVAVNSDVAEPSRNSENENDSALPSKGNEVQIVLDPKDQEDGSLGHQHERRLLSKPNPRLSNPPNNVHGEQVAAGWPSWLSFAAAEAINGWIPRHIDTFQIIVKIGQGEHGNVYKARDALTGNIVALKKVRFDSLEPESVKFITREILILRRLDHPNVIKLEGVVTSRMRYCIYLMFESMEHDLNELHMKHDIKFTVPQVKCYIHQLLSGLEHCHKRLVLHRDIKGSNLLLNKEGILKIADFGSASLFDPHCKQPLTSRVVTLWYRPPELLLGATYYNVCVDLWTVGCFLAELLAGKPIMPGRTEVEQLHKIFKLCGSPSEEYWKTLKLPHSIVFKPSQRYRRCIAEIFKDFPPSSLPLIETLLAIDPAERQTATDALKSEFFTTEPYPSDPASLPKLPTRENRGEALSDKEDKRLRATAEANTDGAKTTRTREHAVRTVPDSEANSILLAALDKRRANSLQAALEQRHFFTTEPYPSDPASLPKLPTRENRGEALRDKEDRRLRATAEANTDGAKTTRTREHDVRTVPDSEANSILLAALDKRQANSLQAALEQRHGDETRRKGIAFDAWSYGINYRHKEELDERKFNEVLSGWTD